MIKNLKERIVGATGSISGAASILGSWQICHNVCLGIIALLSLIGITLVGMPLQFLTTVAVPFWSVAFALLLLTGVFYIKKKCISGRLILFNTGLIIAGIPFQSVQRFTPLFWSVGGIFVFASIVLFVRHKFMRT